MFRFQFLLTIAILISASDQQQRVLRLLPRAKDSLVIAVTDNDPYDRDQKITLRRIKTRPARTIDFITPLLSSESTPNDGTSQDPPSLLSTLDPLILTHLLGIRQDPQNSAYSSSSQHHHGAHGHHHHHHLPQHEKMRQLWFLLIRDQPALAPLLAPILQAATGGAVPAGGGFASPPAASSAAFGGLLSNPPSNALSDDVSQNMPTTIDPVVAQSFLNGIMMGLQSGGLGATTGGTFGSSGIQADPISNLNYMRPTNVQLDDTNRRPANSYNQRPYTGINRAENQKEADETAAADEDFILIGDNKAHQFRNRKIWKKFAHNKDADMDVLYEPPSRKKPTTTTGFNLKPWAVNAYRLHNFNTLEDFILAPNVQSDLELSVRNNNFDEVDDGMMELPELLAQKRLQPLYLYREQSMPKKRFTENLPLLRRYIVN